MIGAFALECRAEVAPRWRDIKRKCSRFFVTQNVTLEASHVAYPK